MTLLLDWSVLAGRVLCSCNTFLGYKFLLWDINLHLFKEYYPASDWCIVILQALPCLDSGKNPFISVTVAFRVKACLFTQF